MHQAGPAHPRCAGLAAAGLPRRVRRHRRRAVDRPVAVHLLRPHALDRAHRRGGWARLPGAAGRAGRGDGSDRGFCAGAGAARPLHQRRRARRGHDPLCRAQDVRPQHADCFKRLGRVRPGHSEPDLPPADRPAGNLPRLRDRRATRACRRRWSKMPARGSARRNRSSSGRWPRSGRRSRRPRSRWRGRRRRRREPARRGARQRKSEPWPDASASRRWPRREPMPSARWTRCTPKSRRRRELLARTTLTESRLQDSATRLGETIGALGTETPAAEATRCALRRRRSTVGATVRSRDGWQGTVVEVDEDGGKATIAAGSLRISVPDRRDRRRVAEAKATARRDDQATGAPRHPDEPRPARRPRGRGQGDARPVRRPGGRRRRRARDRHPRPWFGSAARRAARSAERSPAGQVVARRANAAKAATARRSWSFRGPPPRNPNRAGTVRLLGVPFSSAGRKDGVFRALAIRHAACRRRRSTVSNLTEEWGSAFPVQEWASVSPAA